MDIKHCQAFYESQYLPTGLPMKQLHGTAYDTELMLNIGVPHNQGSLGMQNGFEAIINYKVNRALLAEKSMLLLQ